MRRFLLKHALVACALFAFAFALFALSSDSHRATAGEYYHGHGGGGGWSGGSGVDIGVGVGTILLNQAIRRQQERQQYQQHVTQPGKGCPEGMTWSRKKHTCIKVNGPEIAKCEPPKIKTRRAAFIRNRRPPLARGLRSNPAKDVRALEAMSGSTGNV
jgi:hypothetical protein